MTEKTHIGNFAAQDHVVVEPAASPPPAPGFPLAPIVLTMPPPVAKKPTRKPVTKKPVTKADTMRVIRKLVLVDSFGQRTELDFATGMFSSAAMQQEIEGGVVVKGTGDVWSVNLDSLYLFGGLGGTIEFDPIPDPGVRPITFVRTTEASK